VVREKPHHTHQSLQINVTHHSSNNFLIIFYFGKSNGFIIEFINSCESHKNSMIYSLINYTKMIEKIIFILSQG
jgi:hypothetical protein